MTRTLGLVLKEARGRNRLSLRDVERRTGVRSGHLSQIETETIARPEMAILWDLAAIYGLDFEELLTLAGYVGATRSGAHRRRMTVALRAMEQLTPAEQSDALRYMAALKARRNDD